jgi:outer membrane protein OmpA-like peptidoglycan-associated protein
MMKKGKILLAGALLMSGSLYAQDDKNLVENPGFEIIDGRLRKSKQIEVAKKWFSPTGEKADLYSESTKVPEIGIPENANGNEEATEGENYAGIRAYGYNDKMPRTYIMTQLLGPLKKGVKYCVSFKVSLADFSKFGTNNMSAHLSKKPFEFEGKESISLEDDDIHVQHSQNKIYSQQYNWEPVCTIFEANGGEEWLTIGNFKSNKETRYQRMKIPEGLKGRQSYDAYYYIDDVQVFVLDSIAECDCEKGNIEKEDPNVVYTKKVISKKELTFEQLLEASTIYFADNSNELTEVAVQELDELAVRMKADAGLKIKIVGHQTDAETTAGVSNPLVKYMSQKRINAIVKYLEEKGIEKSRLMTDDQGDTVPVDKSGTAYGQAKNRRVEFKPVG